MPRPAFRDGIDVLAITLGVDRQPLDEALIYLSTAKENEPDPEKVSQEVAVAHLLSEVAKSAFRENSWWLKADGCGTGQLISQCFKKMPHFLRGKSFEEQFDYIRDLLFKLGRSDVDRFPLVKARPSKQLDLKVFARFIGLSDGWLSALDKIMEGSFRGHIHIKNQDRLGLLCVWLVLACGVSSKGELVIALRAIQQGHIRSANGLYWTSGCYEKRRGERRRQWLTKDTLLLVQSIDWSDPDCDLSLNSHAIRDALAQLKRRSKGLGGLNQRALFSAGLARGFLLAGLPTFVINYMSGEISSSSISEASIARLLGLGLAAIDEATKDEVEVEERLFDDTHFDPKPDPIERSQGLSTAAVDDKSSLTKLSRMFSRSDAKAKADAQDFIKTALKENSPPLVLQILEWALERLRVNKPRTVKQALDHLHARLLPVVPGLVRIDDPCQWAGIVEEVTADLEQRSKALSAMSSFAGYLSKTYGEEFASAGRTALSGINAQFVTLDEVNNAISLMERSLDPDLFKIARVLTELAYGGGLRRSEVDGLIAIDVEFCNEPIVKILANIYRDLKTSNAKRYIPLALIEARFPGHINRLEALIQSMPDADQLIFAQYGHLPLTLGDTLFNEITKALQSVCGEKKVTFHSLRHSFCCTLMLALFYKRLSLDQLKTHFSFLQNLETMLPAIRGAVLGSGTEGRFELSSVRGMMGHLSESTTLLHYYHWLDLMRFAGFMKPEAQIVLSDQARYGAAGLKQNSRGRGSKSIDAPVVLEELLSRAAHALPERQATSVAIVVHQFQQTGSLRDALTDAASLGQQVLAGESVKSTVLAGWGTATQATVEPAVIWTKDSYLSGSMARDFKQPFNRLSDSGAIDCLQAMINNLHSLPKCEQLSVANGLFDLAESICTPYVTYRFSCFDDIKAAYEVLETLLAGYPVAYTITAKARLQKDVMWSISSGAEIAANIPSLDKTKYLLKLKRGTEQFPHRAITWLTCALRVCAEAGSSPSP